MRLPLILRNPSRWLHNRIFPDKDQTLCSRANYRQHVSLRWRLFRFVADLLIWPIERDHCRRSFNRYW